MRRRASVSTAAESIVAITAHEDELNKDWYFAENDCQLVDDTFSPGVVCSSSDKPEAFTDYGDEFLSEMMA